MKKFNIWKINGNSDEFCCLIEARDKISALKKYSRSLMSSGIKWIDKSTMTLNTSYGAEFTAVETM